MSRKGTSCHGGIHSPVVACYHATFDYPGSVSVIALMMGKSEEVLRKKLNSRANTHVLTLDEAMHILRLTEDTRILDAICAEAGVVWFAPDNVPTHPGDMDVLKSSTTLMDKAMSVINELQTALENDGEVDADERARIDKCVMELIQASSHLSETARQFEPDRGHA